METVDGVLRGHADTILETFLSGMETSLEGLKPFHCLPLKPSLVEWKHKLVNVQLVVVCLLKPSLVEWKLLMEFCAAMQTRSLKPSLVEWKLPLKVLSPFTVCP